MEGFMVKDQLRNAELPKLTAGRLYEISSSDQKVQSYGYDLIRNPDSNEATPYPYTDMRVLLNHAILEKIKQLDLGYCGLHPDWENYLESDEYVSDTDDEIPQLVNFFNLEVLDVYMSGIKNGSIETLLSCKNLTSLNIGCNGLTVEGLKYLPQFEKLVELLLPNTTLTREGLQIVTGLQNLDSLDLSNTKMEEGYLSEITKMNLKKLYLCGNAKNYEEVRRIREKLGESEDMDMQKNCIGNSGLKQISEELGNLEVLDLEDNGITDDGLVYLLNLKKLKQVILEDNPITDDGLKILFQLGHLDELDLWSTKVSDEGIDKLVEALPQTKIRSFRTLHTYD